MKIKQISDKELVSRAGEEVGLDVESYPNYFLVCITFLSDGSKVWFESDDQEELSFNKQKLLWVMKNFTIITFNGNYYDLPMCYIALFTKCNTRQLHKVSNDIIVNNERPYKIYRRFNINPEPVVQCNTIDLKEVSFGQSSLKTYSGRIHAPNMEDLPYDPETILTKDQKTKVFTYCWNDVQNTIELRNFLGKQIDLRITMGKNYACDLRSKSDAQIAEAVIQRELKWKFSIEAERPKVDYDLEFNYIPPSNITFRTEKFQKLFDKIKETKFGFKENGKLGVIGQSSNIIDHISENIGTYTVGMGGLHSNEKLVGYTEDDEYIYIDRDVARYYPAIILQQKLYPEHLTTAFLSVYKNIVDARLKAKKEGDKVTADSLKITINGSFGKFGSEYSILFSPKLLIQTTVSGQLYLLMLIERLEMNGFTVVSANTDGIVTKVKKSRKEEFDNLIGRWEKVTNFDTEETLYTKYYARDVNNYIAVKTNGDVKYKGCFGETGISKNPAGRIIYKAVANYVAKGFNIDDTIQNSKDIRDFLYVRNVKGGCVNQDGEEIGKVVRWYHSVDRFGPFKYKKNGNKVPKSEGAHECMNLTQYLVDLPNNIDYTWYSYEAKSILESLGFMINKGADPVTGQMQLF